MRLAFSLVPLFLAAACATPARLVMTRDDKVKSIADTAAELAKADVVVLGEQHRTPAVHETHLEMVKAIHERQPNMVIAMEMFERDVQMVLLQYLGGLIDERTFLEKARPWPHYETDYRPIIEFAKQNGLIVLAANAPRALAAKAGKEGVAAVLGDKNVARSTTAPEDEYWDAFEKSMAEHVGTKGDGAMQRMYASQCLKDDTMAESVTDYLQERLAKGDHPLAVLICGSFHSDYRRGTVARIQSRMPSLDIRVVSVESVDDVDAGVYTVPRSIGDCVVVVSKQKSPPEDAEPKAEPAVAKTTKPVAEAPKSGQPETSKPTATAPADEGNPEGLRPALGLMPNYASAAEGVEVESLRENGPAEKAGIEQGDVIVELGGKPVKNVQEYTEVLDTLRIGKSASVRVRRGEAEVVLQVKVGSRTAH